MDKDPRCITEMILNLTLEIIYLLTGEDYGPVQKSSNRHTTPSSLTSVSEWSRSQSPIMEPPPPSLRPERNKKILEVTQKIMELLTDEVSGAGNSGTFSSNRQGMCLDDDCIIVCVRFL
ncbi:unnamed protein product [Staurois parvus]|uniref:Uncharacterized protein n=1 Tax=Staurois parvus TaxID=386267 RepID=A0ABN9DUN0_9NEOB|nr:unnamed protein product [Staurois parvus]